MIEDGPPLQAIERLPRVVLIHIMEYIASDPLDYFHFSCTCKSLYDIFNQDTNHDCKGNSGILPNCYEKENRNKNQTNDFHEIDTILWKSMYCGRWGVPNEKKICFIF